MGSLGISKRNEMKEDEGKAASRQRLSSLVTACKLVKEEDYIEKMLEFAKRAAVVRHTMR